MNLGAFRLQDPFWLLLWMPVLAIGVLGIWRGHQTAVLYSSVQLLRGLPVTMMQRVKRLLPFVRLFGLVIIVFALARPQRGLHEFRVSTEGIAIQMCIDRSGSMRAMDFEIDGERVDRLEAVKDVFHDFVDGGGSLPGRPDDLIGLISFGGFAEGKSPLTLDHGALLEVLKSIQIPEPIEALRNDRRYLRMLQEEMLTAIGDSVALAVDRLKDAKAKSKVIILLSDGENTAGVVSPEDAAKAAKSFGVKIYSIGVGTTGRAPFPFRDEFGRQYFESRPVQLDEEALKMLAATTDGKYFNAKNTQALEQVYAEIDKLEKTISEGRLYTEYIELYQWFMLPGLGLVILEILLSSTRFRSLP